MVPVGTAQVGWTVVEAVGAAGTAGTAFTVTLVAEEIHEEFTVLLAVTEKVPGESPEKVVPT